MPSIHRLPAAALLLFAHLPLPLDAQEARPEAGAALREGLVAGYRSLVPEGGTLARIEPRPAFRLGEGSLHPRLAPGPFAAAWTGSILLEEEEGAVTFGAYLAGGLKVVIDGETVLDERSREPSALLWSSRSVRRPAGAHALWIEYRSLVDIPARLQLWWRGEGFPAEPLSPFRLRHAERDLPPDFAREAERAGGRELVGRFGCARCHAGAFPAVKDPPPGPSLAGAALRLRREWLLAWLEAPGRLRAGARMPALFSPGSPGSGERQLVAERLLRPEPGAAAPEDPPGAGDHRSGKRLFQSAGCAACHFLPDLDRRQEPDLGRTALAGLAGRLGSPHLAAFLLDPRTRYADGRMPRIPLSSGEARDLEAYLLLGSKPAAPAEAGTVREPGADGAAGEALIREKGCARCHQGIEGSGSAPAADIPIRNHDRGCLAGTGPVRFELEPAARAALREYLTVSAAERHPSPFEEGRLLLLRSACHRCHQRHRARPAPIEEVGATLGGSLLERLPFQRVPRLLDVHAKYDAGYLLAAVRDGVRGARGAGYTYRMPAFGGEAEALVAALGADDGDLAPAPDPSRAGPGVRGEPEDPTLHPLGPSLVGFEGYSCVSCHLWKGKFLSDADPGAVGPELTSVPRRIRRAWFDRWLEDPARLHPGTPMPRIFPRGEPALLRSVLEGDAARQRDALWAYLLRGNQAADPRPLPPLPVPAPREGEPPLVAQIPLRLPDGATVESISILTASHDLLVIEAPAGAPRALFTGARILRSASGRVRRYDARGSPAPAAWEPAGGELLGYDRIADGARIRRLAPSGGPQGEVVETIRFSGRKLLREFRGAREEIALPPVAAPPPLERGTLAAAAALPPEGSLERPGYRAIAYPRPRGPGGEDLLMPCAIAVHPRDGRVFVASMKLGEVFVLRDPGGDGRSASFADYTGGLFQEAYSMLADEEALYVLHRRNLSRVIDRDRDGRADRIERVAAIPHGTAETYDYGYGLARDRTGAFVLGFAPYSHRKLPGSGGAIRLRPGRGFAPEEIDFGFRNPVGWCAGPDGEVFSTDNQGEWVATNKLCHVGRGRFHGFPNPEQAEHANRPRAPAAVWVPYDWARSLNGLAFDATGGKFGPFSGQLFIAELMYGGAIIRAALEEVNGEWQGACFPFWGKGLLGPLALAFDPQGRLWVGGITEPGWMAQPDRGGLFRIDFTGAAPFEIASIHVRPRGFKLVFTREAMLPGAGDPAAYEVERWRYEYTGAYGSPEYDRTSIEVLEAKPSAGGREVELTLPPLLKDRVYRLAAPGVRSASGEPLVHPAGAYTLNQVPGEPGPRPR